MKARALAWLILPIMIAAPSRAQDAPPPPIPYLSMLPNYEDIVQNDKEFDAFEFWNGKAKVSVEGKLWDRLYHIKEGVTRASVLQIKRNYSNAVKAMGGSVVFDGLYEGGSPVLVLKASKAGKEIWIQINPEGEGYEYHLYMIEKEAMAQDITASGLMKALESEGRVALDVRFATSKADILPESKSVLDQMIALMKENPTLKVSIEGHTDGAGNAAANKSLSEKRAQSVVAALKAAGVGAERMGAVGWGSEKPVADNKTEEGRAKNRRVELVKR